MRSTGDNRESVVPESEQERTGKISSTRRCRLPARIRAEVIEVSSDEEPVKSTDRILAQPRNAESRPSRDVRGVAAPGLRRVRYIHPHEPVLVPSSDSESDVRTPTTSMDPSLYSPVKVSHALIDLTLDSSDEEQYDGTNLMDQYGGVAVPAIHSRRRSRTPTSTFAPSSDRSSSVEDGSASKERHTYPPISSAKMLPPAGLRWKDPLGSADHATRSLFDEPSDEEIHTQLQPDRQPPSLEGPSQVGSITMQRRRAIQLSPSPSGDSPAKSKTITKAPRMTKKAKQLIEQDRREKYAKQLYDELNERIFKGGLPAETTLKWSNRLLTTAGRARWKRSRDGSQVSEIELATKILDCDERIRNTLSHEMCHLACWIINDDPKEGHGRAFKAWAAKIMKKRPDIEVTTKHNYEINYPYEWECGNCTKIYGRYSKSIKPDECRCGSCKVGNLVPLFTVRAPRTPKKTKAGTAAESRDSPNNIATITNALVDLTLDKP